jgi:hypothetical protein
VGKLYKITDILTYPNHRRGLTWVTTFPLPLVFPLLGAIYKVALSISPVELLGDQQATKLGEGKRNKLKEMMEGMRGEVLR